MVIVSHLRHAFSCRFKCRDPDVELELDADTDIDIDREMLIEIDR
jgi:hypothetical protein